MNQAGDIRAQLCRRGIFSAREAGEISIALMISGAVGRRSARLSRRYIVSKAGTPLFNVQFLPKPWSFRPADIVETRELYASLGTFRVPQLIDHFSTDTGYFFVEEHLSSAISLDRLVESGELSAAEAAEVVTRLLVAIWESGTSPAEQFIRQEQAAYRQYFETFVQAGVLGKTLIDYVERELDAARPQLRKVLSTGDVIDRNILRVGGDWYLTDFEYCHPTLFFFKEGYRTLLYSPWAADLTLRQVCPFLSEIPEAVAKLVSLAWEEHLYSELLDARARLDGHDNLRRRFWNVVEPSLAGRLDQQLAAVREALRGREAELQTRDADLANLRTELDARNIEVAGLHAELQTRDADLANLRTELDARNADVVSLRAELEARDADIVNLRAEAQARDSHVAGLREELRNRDQRIADLSGTVAGLTADLQSARFEMASREYSLQQFRHSLSWRVTAPLRWVRGLLSPILRLSDSTVVVTFTRRLLGAAASVSSRLGIRSLQQRLLWARARKVIRASQLFDPTYYLASNLDVARAHMNPLKHFVLFGAAEGRNPSPSFDIGYYLQANPDVAASGMNPLLHYIEHGAREGRTPRPAAAVKRDRMPPALGGPSDNRRGRLSVSALQATFARRALGAAILATGRLRVRPAHQRLVRVRTRRAIRDSNLFDAAYYLAHNPDVARAHADPLKHFVQFGAAEGRNPGPAFYTRYYLRNNPDVAASGMNPLLHYIEHGAREGRTPRPAAAVKRDHMPPALGGPSDNRRGRLSVSALQATFARRALGAAILATGRLRVRPAHQRLVRVRTRRAIRDSNLFDAAYYLAHNPDVARTHADPLKHFVQFGAAEGRNPSPAFDTRYYLQANPDVAASGMNPLLHYIQHGERENRSPFPATVAHREHGVAPAAADLGGNGGPERNAVARTEDAATSGPDGIEAHGYRLIFEHASWAVAPASHEETWGAYERLEDKMVRAEQQRLAELQVTPCQIIHVDAENVSAHAGGLGFPATDNLLVSVVIPVFNQLRATIECLTALQQQTASTNYEVIVVDDGSADETARILAAVPNLRYLRNESSAGFILARNRGAQAARGKYLVFLNNNVQVTANWLPPLLETFSRFPNVGAIGPKILYPNGRLQAAGVAVNPDLSVTMVGEADDPNQARFNYLREVHYCSGTCLMIEREKFLGLGGFSADLGSTDYEDLDLQLRLRREGLRPLYNPDSVVIRNVSLPIDGLRDSRAYKTRQILHSSQIMQEKWGREVEELNQVRVIAFYFPQYHAFPENEFWWGKGFTEWTNVTKARPNFLGHYQPRLPSELGFYDLRVPETMERQAELAREHGLYGFCYFYYWFAGKRLMELPLERILASGRPDFPFCLSWANENWTRRWDGDHKAGDAMIVQQHSDEDDRAVIRDLIRYLRHPNYIRVNGKPMLLVYRVNLFPNIAHTAEIWRDISRKEGLGDIYLVRVESFEHALGTEPPSVHGFDAAVEYPPHYRHAPINTPLPLFNQQYTDDVHDYEEIALQSVRYKEARYTHFRGVMPCWDNTPRRQDDGRVYLKSSPGAYQAWLEAAIQYTREQNVGDERLVFINAWNEWAEGAYLEPDRKFGRGCLEATRNALQNHLVADQRTRKHHAGLTNDPTTHRRILVIDRYLPTPDQDSGSLRMFNLLSIFQSLGFQVTFVPNDLLNMDPYGQQLQRRGVEVVVAPHISSVGDHLRACNDRYDLVLLSRPDIASAHIDVLRQHAPRARILFDTVDLHFLREAREAALKGDAAVAAAAAARKQQELALAAKADCTLVVSETETDALLQENPALRVRVLSNIHPTFGSATPFAERRDIVFVGGFDHLPNVDATHYFIDEIFPLIRQELPDLTFYLIGSRMPPEIANLDAPHVKVLGYVPDLRPLFYHCRLSVAPLRYGAGVKGKINTSMSYGVPTVATSLAVEGMHLTPEHDVVVADTPKDFAAAVVRVYRDQALWEKLSQNGLENVRRHFSFEAAQQVVRSLLDEIGLAARAPTSAGHGEHLDTQATENTRLRQDWTAGNEVSSTSQGVGERLEFSYPGYRVGSIDARTSADMRVPEISIIIPIFNNLDLTLRCLNSLFRHRSEWAYEIVIIDDGSTDLSESVLGSMRDIRYIRAHENRGFVDTCNLGATHARGRFLVFLNNDTIVLDGWLDALRQTFIDWPRAGLVGSKIMKPSGTLQECGGLVYSDGSAAQYGWDDDPDHPRYCYARETDYVSGAAIMIPHNLFDRLGRFDEYFAPAYYEDTDLAFRVRSAGFQVIVNPHATLIHHEGSTAGTDVAHGMKRFQPVNRLKFLSRWKDVLAKYPESQARPEVRVHSARILVVDWVLPHPDRDSGSVRMAALLRILRDLGLQVTLAASDLSYDAGYARPFERIGIEVLRAPYVESLAQYLSTFGASFDYVLLSRRDTALLHLATVERLCPNATLIFDAVDLPFVREARHDALAAPSDSDAVLEDSQSPELELVRHADVTIVMTAAARERLARVAPEASVRIVSDVSSDVARRELRQIFTPDFTHQQAADTASTQIDATPTDATMSAPEGLGENEESVTSRSTATKPAQNHTARAIREFASSAHSRKVVFVGHDAARAGAQMLLLHLLRWIAKRTDTEIRIVLGQGGELLSEYQDVAQVFVIGDALHAGLSAQEVREKLRDFIGHLVDLVYANTATSGKYLPLLDFVNAPVISHIHELEQSLRKFAGEEAVESTIRLSDRLIAASPPVAQNLSRARGADPARIDIVYEFIEPQNMVAEDSRTRLRSSLGLQPDDAAVFGCGSRDWRKGPDIFVEVAERVLRKGITNFHFFWVGAPIPGEYTNLESSLADRGLSSHVTFLGAKEDPRAYFRAGDIFVLSSREDPFPLVCLEAAECGLPIICFADAGGMPDFVEGDAGFVVPFGDVEAIADAVAKLIRDRSDREGRGGIARKKLNERHTTDVAMPQIFSIIRNVSRTPPLVSVLVPSFNHARYLERRLDSILRQTFQDFEVIVQDDCSTDGSVEILRAYPSRPNLRVVTHAKNVGAFANWLEGLRAASGKIVWIAESDDFCEPEFLERLLPFFEDKRVRLAYSQSNVVDDQDRILGDYSLCFPELSTDKWLTSYVVPAEKEIRDGLAIKNIILNASAVLFRRPNPRNLEDISWRFKLSGDWATYLRIIKGGFVAFCQEKLNYHRRHQTSVIARYGDTEVAVAETGDIHRYVAEHYEIDDGLRERMVEYALETWRRQNPESDLAGFWTCYGSDCPASLREQLGSEASIP